MPIVSQLCHSRGEFIPISLCIISLCIKQTGILFLPPCVDAKGERLVPPCFSPSTDDSLFGVGVVMPGLSNPPGDLGAWLCRRVAAQMSCLAVPQPLKAVRQLAPSLCRSFLCQSCTCSLGKWLQSCCSRHGQLIISGHRLPGAMLLNLIHFSTGSWGSALGCVSDILLQSILGTLQGAGGKEI